MIAGSNGFYSPHQCHNRDVTTTVLRAYFDQYRGHIRILDGFCGLGVRGLKTAVVISNSSLIGVDNNATSIAKAEENCKTIGIQSRCSWIVGDFDEELGIFQSKGINFNVIEIDPFGSPISHIQKSVLSLVEDGLLCLNFTDSSTLFGSCPKSLNLRYGLSGVTHLPSICKYEFGLRVVLATVSKLLLAMSKTIYPIACWSYSNGCRLILRVSSISADAVRLDRLIHHRASTLDQNSLFDESRLGFCVGLQNALLVIPCSPYLSDSVR